MTDKKKLTRKDFIHFMDTCQVEKKEMIEENKKLRREVEILNKKYKRDELWFWVKMCGTIIGIVLFLLGFINLDELQGSLRLLLFS